MTDEPENLTLRLLREMREENASFREEVRQGFQELNIAVAATWADLAIVKDDVAVLKKDVAVLKSDVSALKESVRIIEHDISGIKMRIERIERHTGLVKA